MSIPGRDKTEPPADGTSQNIRYADQIKLRTKFGYLTLSRNPLHQALKIRIIIRKSTGNAVRRNYYKRVLRICIKEICLKYDRYNDCVFYYHYKPRTKFNDIQNELNDKISAVR